ncbi:putative gag protein [Abeliophyllum distichum]|uniref:Gag protein n=1 Tax=Abeliophyllum distichum TaxID=126358 RepID=A0ABD1U088_9LAMI
MDLSHDHEGLIDPAKAQQPVSTLKLKYSEAHEEPRHSRPTERASLDNQKGRPPPACGNQPAPVASVFDRLGVGSSIAPPLPSHNRHNERSDARMEKRKDPKPVHVRPEDEKERLECYEDDDDENLPFTNYMKAIKVPANFRMPLMDKYNWRDDPMDHINIYMTKLQDHFPAVKCQNFHTMLTSDAKRWYNKLKPGSIRSWPQLKREFVNTFIGNRTIVVDIAQLHDIRQKKRETVKSYFNRFSNVINKIKTVTDDKALDALVTGLHMHTPFWRDVQNSQSKTYSQLVDLI